VISLRDIVHEYVLNVLALRQDFNVSVTSGVGRAFLKFLDNGPVGVLCVWHRRIRLLGSATKCA
jgi:hypothetical protein